MFESLFLLYLSLQRMKFKKLKSILLSAIVLCSIFYYYQVSEPIDDKYYGYYENVHGLQKSAPIYFYGVLIGRVSQVDIERNGIVRVILSIRKTTKIPEGTVARITSDPLKGGMAILLKPGFGGKMKTNSTLITSVDSSLTEQFHAKFSPVIKTGREKIKVIDNKLYDIIKLTDTNCKGSMQHKALALKEKIDNFSSTAKKNSANIQKLFSRFDRFNDKTKKIKENTKRHSTPSNVLTTIDTSIIISSRKNVSTIHKQINKANESSIINEPLLYQQTSKQADSYYHVIEKIKKNH